MNAAFTYCLVALDVLGFIAIAIVARVRRQRVQDLIIAKSRPMRWTIEIFLAIILLSALIGMSESPAEGSAVPKLMRHLTMAASSGLLWACVINACTRS
jgi:hypothetical protein